MAGTLEDYKKITYAAAGQQLDQAAKEKKAADAQALTDAQKVVDEQVATQKAPYETKLEEAPGEYQAQFDRNALSEELGRQAVELKLSDMGLTDSGLNVSSQAALSAQRMNADASTRRSMQEYVHGLEDAIRELDTQGEAKKTQLKLDSDAAFDSWYSSASSSVYKQADKDAQTLFQAAQKAATVTQTPEKQTPPETPEKQTPPETPEKQTPAVTPSGSSNEKTAQEIAYEALRQTVEPVLEKVSEWDASVGGIFNTTFWTGPKGDGENVYEDVVEEQLLEVKAFDELSWEQQMTAIAIAIGRSVAKTWPADDDDADNRTRIAAALTAAKEAHGWTEAEYTRMRTYCNMAYKNKEAGA